MCQRLLAAALLMAPGQCIALTETAKRRRAGGAAVAVCVHGQQRNLLAQPVMKSFRDYVVAPLRGEGFRVDVFLVVRDVTSAEGVIARAYNPVYLNLHPPRRGQRHFRTGRARRRARRAGVTRAVMDQWETMITCYEQVVEKEKAVGNYSWIYRLRTDTVYFADVPLPSALSVHNVYTPRFGMSGRWDDMCANDHAFICPRGLCRPYFTVMELFESDKQTADRKVPMRVPSGLHGPPDQPYRLPGGPGDLEKLGVQGLQGQFWFLTRYGARSCDPKTQELPESCCGPIRPVEWYYALARGYYGCASCDVACNYNLAGRGNPSQQQCPGGNTSEPAFCAYVHRDGRSSAMGAQCSKLAREWKSSAECQTPNDKHCDEDTRPRAPTGKS